MVASIAAYIWKGLINRAAGEPGPTELFWNGTEWNESRGDAKKYRTHGEALADKEAVQFAHRIMPFGDRLHGILIVEFDPAA